MLVSIERVLFMIFITIIIIIIIIICYAMYLNLHFILDAHIYATFLSLGLVEQSKNTIN